MSDSIDGNLVERVTVVVQGARIEGGVRFDRCGVDLSTPPLAVGEVRFDTAMLFPGNIPIQITVSGIVDGKRMDLFNSVIPWRG